MQRPIELAVPTTVQPVADHPPGGRLDRRHPGQHGEGGLGTQPARMRPADQHLRGGDRPDPWLGQQHRRDGLDESA
jgi:hypothetical protein